MEELKKLEYDLNQIADAFDIQPVSQCTDLNDWMAANYELNAAETDILEELHLETIDCADYWNEEELKIQFVGLVFLVAKVKVNHKIRVFYERSMTAEVNGYKLAVIADCMVATPRKFNAPQNPYFFLQEFKKGKGEKTDPEAQMLMAMLIAQHLNADNKPVYGGFLVGSEWRFTTLIGKNYCITRKFDAMRKEDLWQIVFNLRKLKELILNR
jgi:hypothetical protein